MRRALTEQLRTKSQRRRAALATSHEAMNTVRPRNDLLPKLKLRHGRWRSNVWTYPGVAPEVLVTDKLASYGCARRKLGLGCRHEQGLRANNRASLFGRLRSSAFKRSNRQSFNCPAGSCFSPESAPRPLHDGVS